MKKHYKATLKASLLIAAISFFTVKTEAQHFSFGNGARRVGKAIFGSHEGQPSSPIVLLVPVVPEIKTAPVAGFTDWKPKGDRQGLTTTAAFAAR